LGNFADVKLIRFTSRGRRLKGLDEFETPEFVGRMDRIQQRHDLTFTTAIFVAVLVGAAIGWLLI
jgi:hypothetical protein